MKKTWKKAVALVLALCAVLSLMLPAAGSANAAAYTFPEIGEPTYLGQHISDVMTLTRYADHLSYGGKDYLAAPALGGMLYIFRLSEYLDAGGTGSDTWVYDSVDTGLGIPGGIDCDSRGNVYVVGGGNEVAIYNISSPGAVTMHPLPSDVSVGGVSVDSYDNIYLSGSKGTAGVVYRLQHDSSEDTGYSCQLLYTAPSDVSEIFTLVSGDRTEDNYVYAQGLYNAGNSSRIYKIHYSSGEVAGSVTYENTGYLYYLSYADGKVFGGNTSSCPGDGMIVVDAATMTKTSLTVLKDGTDVSASCSYISGVVTEPHNGKSYLNISGVGLCEYKDGTATFLRTLSSSLRVRKIYSYKDSTFLMTFGTSAGYLFRLAGNDTVPALSGITAGTSSNWSARTMGPGVEGTGTAVYIGGYWTGRVSSFSPGAENDPLNHTELSNGHAQSDAILPYKGKVYIGCYSGAYLVEYDPATGNVTQLTPNSAAPNYSQSRIHALAAGDDKIFFSTIPAGKNQLGGCIGWYDLNTKELYTAHNVVPDQAVISLVYDEENDILYGATTRAGGGGLPSNSNDEARLMVYDVAGKQVLGNFSIRKEANSASTLSFRRKAGLTASSYTEVMPSYIAGISADPTGKLWGLVSKTLFSFSYNRDTNTLSVTPEWAVDQPSTAQKLVGWNEHNVLSNITSYPTSATAYKFPRPMPFDEVSDGVYHMYVYPTSGSIRQMTISATTKKITAVKDVAPGGRIYTLGADGNLYYTQIYDLYRVSLNKVSITEDLIYTASVDDQASIAEVKAAYNALSSEEQAAIGPSYYQKLQTLLGNECLINDTTYSSLQNALTTAVSGDKVTLLVSQTCDITVNNGITLDLGGKTVTGKVTVANGKLDLNGGSVDGDLTVVNGTVADTTDGEGSVSGTVTLQQDNGKYLPLLDGSVTRFFAYEAKSLNSGYDKKNICQVNFWFDLEFTNQDAYRLLASGSTTNLEVWAELYVNDRNIGADVVFDTKLAAWASEDHSGEDNWALYVGVTNMPASAQTVTVKPYLSANGMVVSMGELTHTVKLPTAEAIFGAYPTDLIK